jgi:hypothetical protein
MATDLYPEAVPPPKATEEQPEALARHPPATENAPDAVTYWPPTTAAWAPDAKLDVQPDTVALTVHDDMLPLPPDNVATTVPLSAPLHNASVLVNVTDAAGGEETTNDPDAVHPLASVTVTL